MSSILKALRRLEEERARKSSVAPEIAASLLRGDTRRRLTPPWVWPVVIIAVAAMATALFWSRRPVPLVSQVGTPVASPATLSRAATAGQGGTLIIEEVMDQRRPVLPHPAPPVPAPMPLPVKVISPPQKADPRVSTPTEANNPATSVIAERQSPVVSAIVWQEDSAARMAVVDGLPVMTGELVGTARIHEILLDRILFIEAGKFFTVYVDPQ